MIKLPRAVACGLPDQRLIGAGPMYIERLWCAPAGVFGLDVVAVVEVAGGGAADGSGDAASRMVVLLSYFREGCVRPSRYILKFHPGKRKQGST